MFASQLPVLLYPSPPEKGSKEETTLQQPTLHISATKEPSRLPNVEIFKVRQLTITALPLLFLIQNISVCDWLKSPGYFFIVRSLWPNLIGRCLLISSRWHHNWQKKGLQKARLLICLGSVEPSAAADHTFQDLHNSSILSLIHKLLISDCYL